MNVLREQGTPRRGRTGRETFGRIDATADIFVRWRSEHAAPQRHPLLIDAEKGELDDTAKLQRMLAKLYPRLARNQRGADAS